MATRTQSKQTAKHMEPKTTLQANTLAGKRHATLRDLRYDFKKIESDLQSGKTIEITRRGNPIAMLQPVNNRRPNKIVWPDFAARVKEIFGDRVQKVSTAEMLAGERERF